MKEIEIIVEEFGDYVRLQKKDWQKCLKWLQKHEINIRLEKVSINRDSGG